MALCEPKSLDDNRLQNPLLIAYQIGLLIKAGSGLKITRDQSSVQEKESKRKTWIPLQRFPEAQATRKTVLSVIHFKSALRKGSNGDSLRA